MKHLINSQDFTKTEYEELFRRAEKFLTEGISPDLCRGKIVATLFFQPSTRTMMASQAAMLRAGGGWIGVMGEQGISMEKGESFEDTIRTFSDLSDCIVLRHPGEDSAERAAKVSHAPVINGGSGSREHAVAACIMLAEFHHLFQNLEGVKVGIYGTPGINRVCKALVPIMGMFGMDLVVDDLDLFPLPDAVVQQAKTNGLKNFRTAPLDGFLSEVDILVCTRGMQKGIIPPEKFSKDQEEEVLKKYTPITMAHMAKLRKDAYLYMITPRIFEIDTAVDSDPRALYMKKPPFTETMLATMTYLLGIRV